VLGFFAGLMLGAFVALIWIVLPLNQGERRRAKIGRC